MINRGATLRLSSKSDLMGGSPPSSVGRRAVSKESHGDKGETATGAQLFLDCDGVLADFDRGAEKVLGMPPRVFEKRFGLPAFWSKLAKHPDFYTNLPLLPGAKEMFAAVRHLDPIILTGCPRGGWAEPQKAQWAAEHFPGTRIITCMARDKRDHAVAGDVLVDDTLRHRHRWEEMGGVFVHFCSAERAFSDLRSLGLLSRCREATFRPSVRVSR